MRKSILVVIIIFALIFAAMYACLVIYLGMDAVLLPFAEVFGFIIFALLFCASVYGFYRLQEYAKKKIIVTWEDRTLSIKLPYIKTHKEN